MNNSTDGSSRVRSTVTHQRTAEALARVAHTKLSAMEQELQALLAEVATTVEQARQDRATAHGYLTHYGIGLDTLPSDQNLTDVDAPINVRTDLEVDPTAVKENMQSLDTVLAESASLYDKLRLALPTIHDLRRQLAPDTWMEPIGPTSARYVGQAVVTAREDERRRLARELHDGPAQVVANAIFSVEIAEHIAMRSPEHVPEELERLRDVLKLGMAEIRRLMFDLRPSTLDDVGLVATVRRYVTDYNRFFGKDVHLEVTEELPPLTPDETLSIFRIIQESLQNVQQHAQTDTAAVSLTWSPPLLVVNITDNGRGFRTESHHRAQHEGLGLHGMRERAELVGADFAIASQPGSGTAVMFRLDLSSRVAGAGLHLDSKRERP